MRIFNRDVGPGHPVFVVAEGGSCHGGSLDAALALTDAAAEAGANAFKWQLWLSADEMYDRDQFPEEWASADKYRLPVEWLPQLRDRAHERGMAFGLSSFGFASLEEADKWVDFHKVASIEATWEPFVTAVGKKKKPTFISTGALSQNEIGNCVAPLVDGWGGIPDIVLLQCVVAYPAALNESDLLVLGIHQRIIDGFPVLALGKLWIKVGLSDHTTHPTIAPCAAVALGACVIEKHLRLYDGAVVTTGPFQEMSTPDAPHSIDPHEFRQMTEAIRLTEKALGSSEKRIRPSEEKYLRYRRGPRGLRGA